MKLVVYSSRTRGFDGQNFVVRTVNSYEVECEGKMHLGNSREKTHQVVELGNQICRCTCRKPQLLHIPSSHVIIICYELQQFTYHRYVPWYYGKETVRNIWN
jgi:hypothetical protein